MATVKDEKGNVILTDNKVTEDELANSRKHFAECGNGVLTFERAVELGQNMWPVSAVSYRHRDKLTDDEKVLLKENIVKKVADLKDDIRIARINIKRSNETERHLHESCGIKKGASKGYRSDQRKLIKGCQESINGYIKISNEL